MSKSVSESGWRGCPDKSRNNGQVGVGGGEGEVDGVPEQEDEQGGLARRHEDLHEAALPAEEEDKGEGGVEELGLRAVQRGAHPQPQWGAGGAGHGGQLQEDLLARSEGLWVSEMIRGGFQKGSQRGHWGGAQGSIRIATLLTK